MRSRIRYRQQFKFCLALSFLSLLVLYLYSYRSNRVLQTFNKSTVSKEDFITAALQASIDNRFEHQALRALCDETTWTEGLVFQCDARGGIGNVMNMLLDCVRFSIEAGGAIIVPKIVRRSQTNLSEIFTNELVDFSYFFDRQHFITSLSAGCPQMRIYDSIDDLAAYPSAATPIPLNPSDLLSRLRYEKIIANPALWRSAFDSFLESHIRLSGISKHVPRVIHMSGITFEFPVSYDPPSFTRTFGRLLRFRLDTRRLAASALFSLSTEFSLNLDPVTRGPYRPSHTSRSFFGAHLRTASDAMNAGWPGYEFQAPYYLSLAASSGFSTIYLASDSRQSIKKFRVDALNSSITKTTSQNIAVVTKNELLSGAELQQLESLTWDQQALVDFQILLHSGLFAGNDYSSFAWAVGLRRHLFVDEEEEDDVTYLDLDEHAFADQWSVIFGAPGRMGFFPRAMWP